jgi:hypothetical protein
MPDFLYAIALLRDSVWGGIAVVTAILIPVLAQLLRSAPSYPHSHNLLEKGVPRSSLLLYYFPYAEFD